MRGILAALALALFAGPVASHDWQGLSGPEIVAALTDNRVMFERARQSFFASGRTAYVAGQKSWGNWRVEGDKYCSQWPPQGRWACYRVEQHGYQIRFVGDGDDVTEGLLMGAP